LRPVGRHGAGFRRLVSFQETGGPVSWLTTIRCRRISVGDTRHGAIAAALLSNDTQSARYRLERRASTGARAALAADPPPQSSHGKLPQAVQFEHASGRGPHSENRLLLRRLLATDSASSRSASADSVGFWSRRCFMSHAGPRAGSAVAKLVHWSFGLFIGVMRFVGNE
jgi:hypothetical protein